ARPRGGSSSLLLVAPGSPGGSKARRTREARRRLVREQRGEDPPGSRPGVSTGQEGTPSLAGEGPLPPSRAASDRGRCRHGRRAADWLRARVRRRSVRASPRAHEASSMRPPSPQAVLLEMWSGYVVSRALSVVAELAIADHLADGPKTDAELAAATGANEDALHRVLRMLAARGVFAADESGRVGL